MHLGVIPLLSCVFHNGKQGYIAEQCAVESSSALFKDGIDPRAKRCFSSDRAPPMPRVPGKPMDQREACSVDRPEARSVDLNRPRCPNRHDARRVMGVVMDGPEPNICPSRNHFPALVGEDQDS